MQHTQSIAKRVVVCYLYLHTGHISVCGKTSSTFPASNALSSSHSKVDDSNKGVDLRPVIISWECWCKATDFWGSKPRRREGRHWGWGGHICGAAEATGVVIGREVWKPILNIFLLSLQLWNPEGLWGLHFPLIHVQWNRPKRLRCCRWKRLGPAKSPFSLFLHKATPKNEDISEKKNYSGGRSLWLHSWGCKHLERL